MRNELDRPRRIGDCPLIVSLKIERCGATVERGGIRWVKFNGARRIGDGAVVVPLCIAGLGALVVEISVVSLDAYRLVVIGNCAVVLAANEAGIAGIEKNHCQVGL